jgi:predicted DNA-binding protein (UPF0278 family)
MEDGYVHAKSGLRNMSNITQAVYDQEFVEYIQDEEFHIWHKVKYSIEKQLPRRHNVDITRFRRIEWPILP